MAKLPSIPADNIVEAAESNLKSADSKSSRGTMKDAKQKNLAAVLLGRLGGLKGGKARAAKLSAQERIEIARKAARARWDKQSS
jgi:hypothetical protein